MAPAAPNLLPMRRHAIGIITLLLFGGAIAFWIWPPEATGWQVQFEAACWRVGLLMAVVWIAYPQLERIPTWIWTMALFALIAVAVKPRAALLAIPLVIALAILRPRYGRRK